MISGTLALGSGPKFDEAAAHENDGGRLRGDAAGMEHFAWCKSGA